MANLVLNKLPFGQEIIKKALPHRDPFLFVDEVTELEIDERIVAHRIIPKDDRVFEGHFPDNPMWPGVLQVEGLAQASGILVAFTPEGEFSSCVLTEINSARYRQPVKPGDRLEYRVKIVKSRAMFFWFEGKAYVDDKLTCQAEFSARMFK